MTDDELRVWFRRHVRRGARKHINTGKDHPFPTLAFCRWTEWDQRKMNQWLMGYGTMPDKYRRKILRFIDLWDSGLIDVVEVGLHRKKEIVVRDTPKRTPIVMKVAPQGAHGKLALTRLPSKSVPVAPAKPVLVKSNFMQKISGKRGP